MVTAATDDEAGTLSVAAIGAALLGLGCCPQPSSTSATGMLLRRIQDKVRQHTLQAAGANALDAKQIGGLLEALELRAKRDDGFGTPRPHAG